MQQYKAGYKKKYWFIDWNNGSGEVREDINTFSLKHISRFTLGNMFPNKESALEKMNRLLDANVVNI